MNPLKSVTPRRALAVLTLTLATLVSITFSKEITAAASSIISEAFLSGTISGRVFQDYNANGSYDTTAGTNSIDAGVANVNVNAYDGGGVLAERRRQMPRVAIRLLQPGRGRIGSSLPACPRVTRHRLEARIQSTAGHRLMRVRPRNS